MTKKQDWLFEDDDMMGEPEKNEDDNSDAPKTKKESKETKKSGEEQQAEETTRVLEHPSYKKLADDLTEMEKAAFENREKYLHAMAEMDTVRRRSREQIDKEKKYAVSGILEELIPILDSFNQSLLSVQETDHEMVASMREGMSLTLQMLQKALAKYGVKEIDPVANEPFNPSYHEVMMAQESAEATPNAILSVLQKGYQLHDRVIRPARVIVAKAPAKSSDNKK